MLKGQCVGIVHLIEAILSSLCKQQTADNICIIIISGKE